MHLCVCVRMWALVCACVGVGASVVHVCVCVRMLASVCACVGASIVECLCVLARA